MDGGNMKKMKQTKKSDESVEKPVEVDNFEPPHPHMSNQWFQFYRLISKKLAAKKSPSKDSTS